MQPCCDARRRPIVAKPKHAPLRLGLGPGAPPGDKRARERSLAEIDRYGVVQHAARPRWRHRPAVAAAVPVEPGGHFRVTLTETARWNGEPDADRKSLLGHRDHLARVAWHVDVPYLFRHKTTAACPRPEPGPSGCLRLRSDYVWPCPSLLRSQRDQARVLDPDASSDT